jgi:hypothetical protein
MRRSIVALLNAGLFLFSASAFAQTGGACDLNSDGKVDSADKDLAVNMAVGLTACNPNINIYGQGVCNVVVVQRVTNAVLTGNCVTGTTIAHSVTLTWTASATSGVTGYNVYRGGASTGPFSKVNATVVNGNTYTDTSVAAGGTYYYVATAVAGSGESGYSTPAVQAKVPTP